MSVLVKEAVRFVSERLFDGAVSVDWLQNNQQKAELVADSFVFHGPAYHGVSANETPGYRLIDTATFFRNTLYNIQSGKGKPFTLAIAGYGSGKSHLALTLSKYLEGDNPKLQRNITSHIQEADEILAEETAEILSELSGKVLVITLNGMNNFNLCSAILLQAKQQLQKRGISTSALDNLQERFTTLCTLFQNLNDSQLEPLLEECSATKEEIIQKLQEFDEKTYICAIQYLESIGLHIRSFGDETVKEVLNSLANEYIGPEKPFQHLLILFDEFSHYMEFATARSYLAGPGALQHLYEGIQDNSDKITFIGFIQYELKAYAQRLSVENRNEIQRFISRFQNAERLYLSINLETLIASLLVKSPNQFELCSDYITEQFDDIQKWFPAAQNHKLWSSMELFTKSIAHGCWPLSPMLLWILFHLSAGGQYLQQRSAFTLLKSALAANEDFVLTSEAPCLPPVRLWSVDLQQEFEQVEEQSGTTSVMQSYNAILERCQQHLSEDQILILRSIVLTSMTHLKVNTRGEALQALTAFSGLPISDFRTAIKDLEEDLNVITWDESFHQFEIVNDGVSKSQFLKFLRKKAKSYDLEHQAGLFIKMSSNSEDLKDIECDFAIENNIQTLEWKFESRIILWSNFEETLRSFVDLMMEKSKFQPIDQPRGLIFYCYVPSNEDIDDVQRQGQKILRSIALKYGRANIPVMIAFLFDSGEIGKVMAEMDVIEKFTEEEKSQFGRLSSAYYTKQLELFKEKIRQALLERHFVTSLKDEGLPVKLAQLGNSVFTKIFNKPLPFPFDGLKSMQGNGASDCQTVSRYLLMDENFTYSSIQQMSPRSRNRADMVLSKSWQIFLSSGSIGTPKSSSVRAIMQEWETKINSNEGLNGPDALAIACASPYGANLASATLLLAVFIQKNLKSLQFLYNDAPIELRGDIVDKLLAKKVFTPQTVQNFVLLKAENKESEWYQFFNGLVEDPTYHQQLEYLHQAQELNCRLVLPRDLYWRMVDCQKNAKIAQEKINEMDERINDAFRQINKGNSLKNASTLAFGASLLQSIVNEEKNSSSWGPDDYSNLENQLIEYKQNVELFFRGWLDSLHIPQNAEGLSNLKYEIDRTKKSFKNLQLTELSEELSKYYSKIAKIFEKLEECRQKLDSVQQWIDSVSLSNATSCYLLECKEKIKKFLLSIKQIHNFLSTVSIPQAELEQSLIKKYQALKKLLENIDSIIKR